MSEAKTRCPVCGSTEVVRDDDLMECLNCGRVWKVPCYEPPPPPRTLGEARESMGIGD